MSNQFARSDPIRLALLTISNDGAELMENRRKVAILI